MHFLDKKENFSHNSNELNYIMRMRRIEIEADLEIKKQHIIIVNI